MCNIANSIPMPTGVRIGQRIRRAVRLLQCCTDPGPAQARSWVPDLRSNRFGISEQVPDPAAKFSDVGTCTAAAE